MSADVSWNQQTPETTRCQGRKLANEAVSNAANSEIIRGSGEVGGGITDGRWSFDLLKVELLMCLSSGNTQSVGRGRTRWNQAAMSPLHGDGDARCKNEQRQRW